MCRLSLENVKENCSGPTSSHLRTFSELDPVVFYIKQQFAYLVNFLLKYVCKVEMECVYVTSNQLQSKLHESKTI